MCFYSGLNVNEIPEYTYKLANSNPESILYISGSKASEIKNESFPLNVKQINSPEEFKSEADFW